ncbi:hypothetical protein SAMN05216377_12624 [Pseudonocardia oroxyli]|uniref:DUF5313 domain-containing protein n=1 Tax=Pseudonocardia oroxyli TaxID=366584 RepID=A0A1G8DF97_PSEOR|nr:hypothetical protein SAMN05216377_12624 [Pseudonocardia oroxyli]
MLRWVWYACGGRLPARYADWVLHDATCSTWVVRHLARTVVPLVIVSVPIVLLVPGPLWVRLCGLLLGWLVSAQFAIFLLHDAVDHRVRRAGYPPGYAQAVRDVTARAEREARRAAYRRRYG